MHSKFFIFWIPESACKIFCQKKNHEHVYICKMLKKNTSAMVSDSGQDPWAWPGSAPVWLAGTPVTRWCWAWTWTLVMLSMVLVLRWMIFRLWWRHAPWSKWEGYGGKVCQQKGFVMINCYIRSTNSPCFDIGQWSAEVNWCGHIKQEPLGTQAHTHEKGPRVPSN